MFGTISDARTYERFLLSRTSRAAGSADVHLPQGRSRRDGFVYLSQGASKQYGATGHVRDPARSGSAAVAAAVSMMVPRMLSVHF